MERRKEWVFEMDDGREITVTSPERAIPENEARMVVEQMLKDGGHAAVYEAWAAED